MFVTVMQRYMTMQKMQIIQTSDLHEVSLVSSLTSRQSLFSSLFSYPYWWKIMSETVIWYWMSFEDEFFEHDVANESII